MTLFTVNNLFDSVNRDERTDPQCPAVIGINGEGDANNVSLTPHTNSPVSPTQIAQPENSQARSTRLVGFGKLKSLLQPVHRYFRDKLGYVKQFALYRDDKQGIDLAYPIISGHIITIEGPDRGDVLVLADRYERLHRDNPYRRRQQSHRASQRTFKRLRKFVDRNKLDDFEVASLTLTMPKNVSEFITSIIAENRDKGKRWSWTLFEGFWNEDLPAVVNQDIYLASHTNLHLWRSENPTQPHVHFHSLIANYGLTESNIEDDNGEKAMELKLWKWHRQRGGTLVPFSEEQLEDLKKRWQARINRFARKHGLEEVEGKVDVYVDYVDDWPRLLHKLNYNGRHWSENYAEYSNDNPDCEDPPAWLEGYENKSRVRGWWSNLKSFVVDDTERDKVSPYTGESMQYLFRTTYDGLIYHASTLGLVDFVRGQAVEVELTIEQQKWLKEVMADSENIESCKLPATLSAV